MIEKKRNIITDLSLTILCYYFNLNLTIGKIIKLWFWRLGEKKKYDVDHWIGKFIITRESDILQNNRSKEFIVPRSPSHSRVKRAMNLGRILDLDQIQTLSVLCFCA